MVTVLPMYLMSFAAYPNLNKKIRDNSTQTNFAPIVLKNCICLIIHRFNLPVNDNDCPTGILTKFGFANAGFGNNAFFFLRFCFPPLAPLA